MSERSTDSTTPIEGRTADRGSRALPEFSGGTSRSLNILPEISEHSNRSDSHIFPDTSERTNRSSNIYMDVEKGGGNNSMSMSLSCCLYRQRISRERVKKRMEINADAIQRLLESGDAVDEEAAKKILKKRYQFHQRVLDKLKEFENVLWYFEEKLIMHRLSAHYYNKRALWFTFLPILFVTSVVSVIGLFSSVSSPNNCISKALTITSGSLGIVSTFLASWGKQLNYQSKADMHASARQSLSKLCDKIKLDIFQFQMYVHSFRKEVGDGQNNGNGKEINWLEEFNKTGANLKHYRIKYETTKEACTSSFPNKIEQAFASLKHMFEPATHDVKRYLYPRSYHALARSIANQKDFPLFLNRVDLTEFCEKELNQEHHLMQQWQEEEQNKKRQQLETQSPDEFDFSARPGTPPLPIPFGNSSSGNFSPQASSSSSTGNRNFARRSQVADQEFLRSSLSINVPM